MPTAKWINLIEGFPPFPWPTLTKPTVHSRSYPAQAHTGQDLKIEQFIAKFLVDPSTETWSDGSVKKLVLEHLFGSDALRTGKSQPTAGPTVRFGEIVVAANGALVNLIVAQNGMALAVRLNERMDIVEATKGGVVWPVVHSTFGAPSECGLWFPPSEVELPSPQGAVTALRFLRFFTAPGDSGEQSITLGSAKAVLAVASGDLWIGPNWCNLVVIDGRMLGIVVDTKAGEIQVFSGPRARLPLPVGTARAFQDQLRQFESSFIAGGYRFQPDWKVSLPGLFAGDDRFANGCKFNLYRVSTKGNAIVLYLTSSNPNAHPEVTLSPDLKTISTRVLDPGEFRRLFAR